MNIVIYAYRGGGYGDLLFALKTTAYLQQAFPESKVILVTPAADKEIIAKVGGDTEYKVKVHTIDEFNKEINKDDFKIDRYIECPLQSKVQDNIISQLKVPQSAVVILGTEYSCNMQGKLNLNNMIQALTKKKYSFQVVNTGLHQEEKGVWLEQKLLKILQQKKSGDFSFRNECWRILEKPGSIILSEKNVDTYFDHTDLSIQYGNQAFSFNDFLKVLLAMTSSSKKNQDIICIGRSAAEILKITENNLAKTDGVKVIYLNCEEEEPQETVVVDSKDPSAKIIRVIHFKQLTHEQICALVALAFFAGMTGDQSLGEVMSDGILFCYEALKHKVSLSNNICDFYLQYIKFCKFEPTKEKILSELINFLYRHHEGLEEAKDPIMLSIMRKPNAEKCLKYLKNPVITNELKNIFANATPYLKYIDLSTNLKLAVEKPECKLVRTSSVDSRASSGRLVPLNSYNVRSSYPSKLPPEVKRIFTLPTDSRQVPKKPERPQKIGNSIQALATLNLVSHSQEKQKKSDTSQEQVNKPLPTETTPGIT